MPTTIDHESQVWDVYVCGICGGQAGMGLMSLVARCRDCGSRNVDYPPKTWELASSEGAD